MTRGLIAVVIVGALSACDPWSAWPDDGAYYPYVYTQQADLEPYEEVRWETETWDPSTDLTQAGQYLLKLQHHRPGAPIESLDHYEAMRPQLPPLGEGVRISLVGDVMWVGENWDAFADPVGHLIDGDLRVGNLETPTSPDHPTDLEDLDLYTFNAPPEMLDGLPLDLLQLNNNHSVDVGPDGLEATVEQVDLRGYGRAGVDEHTVVEVGGRSIAFLSYTWGLNGKPPPPDHELFVVPFGHIGEDIDLAGLEEDVAEARGSADAVVVLVHWGFEYEYYADPHFMVLGRSIVAAGADLVVGTGPHVVQPAELCHVNQPEHVPGVGVCSLRTDDAIVRDAAILYSLGNFVTTQPGVELQTGIVATVSLDPDVTGLGWTPVATSRVDGWRQVHPLQELVEGSADHAREVTRLDEHLGTGWKR